MNKNTIHAESKETITIFFSWQLTIPKIREYLNEWLPSVINELQKAYPEKDIILDKDTDRCFGSPDIHDVVFRKINNCSIFIADVSLTYDLQDWKKLPNPNVMLELGFAIRAVGWDRIILLLDKATGKPEQLPFDIRSHEVLLFSKERKENQKETNAFNDLKDKINKIIDGNPPRICEYGDSVNELRRLNDIYTIRDYLKTIPINSIDSFINDMPYKFNKNILGNFEEFESLIKSNNYYLFDDKIRNLFNAFFKLWDKCLSYGTCYEYNTKTDYFIFTDNPYDPYQDSNNAELNKNIKLFQKSFKTLLEEIRINWSEITFNQGFIP